MERSYAELVPLRTSHDEARLLCVGGGWLGGDKNFHDMAAAMKTNQSVYQFRAVNLDDACLSVEQLAAVYLKQLCAAQEHGPYRLLGYSFGGLVVYEMAVTLLDRGEEIGLLALIDTPNPMFVSSGGFSRFRKTYLVNRVQKYAKNLIQGRIDYFASDVSQFIVARVKPITWKITHTVQQALGRPPSSVNRHLVMNKMWNSYAPKKFGGRLVLFRAEDRREFDSDRSWGWHKSAQRVDVHFVPGDHVTMMRMPNVLNLVEKLPLYLTTSIHRDE